MEFLWQEVDNGKIAVAKPNDRVFKDECVFSFDSPVSLSLVYSLLILICNRIILLFRIPIQVCMSVSIVLLD